MHPNMVILYVDNPVKSTVFYADLLKLQPVESSPTFALFILESGLKLGLWSKHTVEPVTMVSGGGIEIAFPVESREAVERAYADWASRGLTILQSLTDMDFGFTFVAIDPDGHRLRVYVLHSENKGNQL